MPGAASAKLKGLRCVFVASQTGGMQRAHKEIMTFNAGNFLIMQFHAWNISRRSGCRLETQSGTAEVLR